MEKYFRNLKDFAVPETKKLPNAVMQNASKNQPYC
jgi:hypothetical protein